MLNKQQQQHQPGNNNGGLKQQILANNSTSAGGGGGAAAGGGPMSKSTNVVDSCLQPISYYAGNLNFNQDFILAQVHNGNAAAQRLAAAALNNLEQLQHQQQQHTSHNLDVNGDYLNLKNFLLTNGQQQSNELPLNECLLNSSQTSIVESDHGQTLIGKNITFL